MAGCAAWFPADGGIADDTEAGVACDALFVGDPNAEPEMAIVHRTTAGMLVEAVPFGTVELFRPPQGGKVFLTAARIRNVDACGLRIEASLRDGCTERILGFEGRPFLTRVNDAGWLEPLSASSFSSWANVPACPTAAADRHVDDGAYVLTVRVIDRAGRRASDSLAVIPRCVEPGYLGRQCRCECRADYRLGDTCQEHEGASDDAGTPTVPIGEKVPPHAGTRDGGTLNDGLPDAAAADAGAQPSVCPTEAPSGGSP